MKKVLRCCCVSAMVLFLGSVKAEELAIASLIRTKCVDETKSYLNGKKGGILYISDRFEKHLNKLKEKQVDCGYGLKINWLEAKFKLDCIKSVKNVILSELCRIYCDINPYKSGRYTDDAKDVLLLDANEEFGSKKIFKDISSYDRANWNYIFLINYMNWLKNEALWSNQSTHDFFKKRLEAISKQLVKNKVEISLKMAEDMAQATQDIEYYVDNLRIKEFWNFVWNEDEDCLENKINNNETKVRKFLQQPINERFYHTYNIAKKTGAPYGIANAQNGCHIATVIEMLYSNKKIRDKIRGMVAEMKIGDAFNPEDIDVNDNSPHTDKDKREIIEKRNNYGNSNSKHVALLLNRIFNRLDQGLVSSAYILELSNIVNKCNIIDTISKDKKFIPKLNPYYGDDPIMSLDALISALAGIDLEFDKGSLDLIKQDLALELDKIQNEGESSINSTMSENVKNKLTKLAKQQTGAKRISDRVGLEDYITRMSAIGSLICVKREETVTKKDGNDISKRHPKPKTTCSYARTIFISRSDNDLQKCLNRSIQKTETMDNALCSDCTERNYRNAVYHTMHTEEKYMSSPSVLILDAGKKPLGKKQFSKLHIPDYLTGWNRQYVLRSAIVKQNEHHIMKGIAQNGDIYCIDDDGSAIMRPDPKKPGTAHYEMPKERQMIDKRHHKNSAIQGDKTLNHLDVEDGIVFMYEQINW